MSDLVTIPCLSVRQPWAWAIAQGLKPWENRPQRRRYRGPLLIHAGTAIDPTYDQSRYLIRALSGVLPPAKFDVDRGGIVGAAVLTGCAEPLNKDDGWRFAGQFGLKVERAITLPTRPLRGMLGLFKVELKASERAALRAAGIL